MHTRNIHCRIISSLYASFACVQCVLRHRSLPLRGFSFQMASVISSTYERHSSLTFHTRYGFKQPLIVLLYLHFDLTSSEMQSRLVVVCWPMVRFPVDTASRAWLAKLSWSIPYVIPQDPWTYMRIGTKTDLKTDSFAIFENCRFVTTPVFLVIIFIPRGIAKNLK